MDEEISDQDDSGKYESLEIFVLNGGIQGRKGGSGEDGEVRIQNVCLELWEFSRQLTDCGRGWWGGVLMNWWWCRLQ